MAEDLVKKRERQRRWRQANRDKINAWIRLWRKKAREKAAAIDARGKAKRAEYYAAYYKARDCKPERIARLKRYDDANPLSRVRRNAKANLAKSMGVAPEAVPSTLVEAKVALIVAKRAIKTA